VQLKVTVNDVSPRNLVDFTVFDHNITLDILWNKL
jgi:hypothetical protein